MRADANDIRGEAFNCYDRYISEYDVAMLAKQLTGSSSHILGGAKQPKHRIVTNKIQSLGLEFGGDQLLETTIGELVDAARATM